MIQLSSSLTEALPGIVALIVAAAALIFFLVERRRVRQRTHDRALAQERAAAHEAAGFGQDIAARYVHLAQAGSGLPTMGHREDEPRPYWVWLAGQSAVDPEQVRRFEEMFGKAGVKRKTFNK